MRREIEPIKSKVTAPVRAFGESQNPNQLLSSSLRNPAEQGWHFQAGDPEFWKFANRLLVPEGKILDLGVGRYYRSSLFFALQGMKVIGFETSKEAVKLIRAVAAGYRLPLIVKELDATKTDLGQSEYDTALLGQTFVHSPSRHEAYTLIEKVIEALKPKGHLWLRAAGKESSAFEQLPDYALNYPHEVWRIDEDTFMAPCFCSGVRQLEPHFYFDALNLLYFINRKGLKVIHSQIIPEKGRANIMYGEDWIHDIPPEELVGFITIIAQK